MAKIFVTTYQVMGNGRFPMDMLRYDSSWPKGSSDAFAIERRNDGERGPSEPITLVHWSGSRQWQPTHGRWSSFSWVVVAGSVETQPYNA
jgi:hypothetical protein